MKIHADDLRAFWFHVEKGEGCWSWRGSVQSEGYGKFRLNGRQVYAHRLSYELHKGPIPDGLTIDHLCRVRRCVNPDHLEAVTHLENVRRGAVANRPTCPNGHPYDHMTDHGRTRDCRRCRNDVEKRYYESHKAVIAEQRRARRLANRDEVNRKQREYRERRATCS